MKFSVVIPLYNRPDELDELLESLCAQTFTDFEVVVVEDGSTQPGDQVAARYQDRLDLHYWQKPNSGPGPSRNFGAAKASGDYLVFFDSDCLIPPTYFERVQDRLNERYTDAYGGPDAAHPGFSPLQKAISYSMTSFFTTGGIRGGSEKAGKFHPRSFNLGVSKQAFEAIGGYSEMRFGEDIDFTLRLLENGFQTQLIQEAFVYHKRRTDFRKFYRQVYNSGCARINLYVRHPQSLKAVHCFPALFLVGNLGLLVACAVLALTGCRLAWICLLPALGYSLLLLADSGLKNGLRVGLLSVVAAWCQLGGYGAGFLKAVWHRLVLKETQDTTRFTRNFYK